MNTLAQRLITAIEGAFWSTLTACLAMLGIGILLGLPALAWPGLEEPLSGFLFTMLFTPVISAGGGAIMGAAGAWLQPQAFTIKRWLLFAAASFILTILFGVAGIAAAPFQVLFFVFVILASAVIVPVNTAFAIHRLLRKRSPLLVIISRTVEGILVAVVLIGLLALNSWKVGPVRLAGKPVLNSITVTGRGEVFGSSSEEYAIYARDSGTGAWRMLPRLPGNTPSVVSIHADISEPRTLFARGYGFFQFDESRNCWVKVEGTGVGTIERVISVPSRVYVLERVLNGDGQFILHVRLAGEGGRWVKHAIPFRASENRSYDYYLTANPHRPEEVFVGVNSTETNTYRTNGNGHSLQAIKLPPLRALHRSTDGGQSWRPIRLPSMKDNPGASDGIFAVACVPGAKPLLLVFTRQTPWVSRDNGRSWQKFPLSAGISVFGDQLWVAQTDPPTVFLYAPFRLYATQNQGHSWRDTGLFSQEGHSYPLDIVSDPSRPDIVYMLTDRTVYCSADGGRSWKSIY